MVKLKVCPKLGEYNTILDSGIVPYLNDTFEIQMVSKDLVKSWENCKRVIECVGKYTNVKEVILHMPFQYHTLEIIYMSYAKQRELIRLITNILRYSDKTNIAIGILFHSDLGTDYLQHELIEYIKHLLDVIRESKVYLLIENVMPDIGAYNIESIPAFELLQRVEDEKLVCCFDICHFRASENIVGKSIAIPENIIGRIHEVHFSATLNNDGFRDKKNTHGVVHNDYADLDKDLKIVCTIQDYSKDLVVVIEVAEVDYNNRVNMIAETIMVKEWLDKNC